MTTKVRLLYILPWSRQHPITIQHLNLARPYCLSYSKSRRFTFITVSPTQGYQLAVPVYCFWASIRCTFAFPPLPSFPPRFVTGLTYFECSISLMTFRIADVDTKTDFEDLVSCQWAAFENPFQGIVRLICPILGTGPSARSEALKEGSDRQRDWYKGDPTSYWQKAVNDDGQIVGGALWKICENNPFAQSPSESTVVYWYPEGPEREFAAMALQRLDMPRKRMAQRPQICALIKMALFSNKRHISS